MRASHDTDGLLDDGIFLVIIKGQGFISRAQREQA
jgi:hypothetical protein